MKRKEFGVLTAFTICKTVLTSRNKGFVKRYPFF